MKLVLLPDKFKGSLTAAEVCDAITRGVRQVHPAAELAAFPASDGGDGFLEAVRAVRDVETVEGVVEDPLGREIRAPFLLDAPRGEAFLEMAAASGMGLLSEARRNPMKTHTRGTGQLLLAALRSGARRIYVGLGGSATNDGGCGLATAFGYRFLDARGTPLAPVGENLMRLERILPPEDLSILEGVEVVAVNDVSNPLWGPQGAAFVYAAQKGASDPDIEWLDAGLRRLDRIVSGELGIEASGLPGAGAAGGAAYGLHCFLNARLIRGTDYVLGISGVEGYLKEHAPDFIITGEGRIDAQTLSGKWLQGVLRLAGHHGVPVLAVCGACDLAEAQWKAAGLKEVLQVSDPARPLSYNMAHAARLVGEAVRRYFADPETPGATG